MKRQSIAVPFPYITKKGSENNEAYIEFLRFATCVFNNIFDEHWFSNSNVM